jgi:hypothetical protein
MASHQHHVDMVDEPLVNQHAAAPSSANSSNRATARFGALLAIVLIATGIILAVSVHLHGGDQKVLGM